MYNLKEKKLRSAKTEYIRMGLDNLNLSINDEEDNISSYKKNNNAEAKRNLFLSHIKLVISIAKTYSNYKIHLDDLISEGVIGLEIALENFDISKNIRFSTYARHWIKSRINTFFRENIRPFSIPLKTSSRIFQINSCYETLNKELSRIPTSKEIGERLKLDGNYVDFLRKYLLPVVELNQNIDNGIHDFNQPIELIIDDRNTPYESTLRNDSVKAIKKAILCLTSVEQRIINYRYGLDCNKILTLSEVGIKMKMTGERIRQIQNSAEERLSKIIDK